MNQPDKKAEDKAISLAVSLGHRLGSFRDEKRNERDVRVATCMYCNADAIVGPGKFTRSGPALSGKCEHSPDQP
jgi:hypothetical protein